MKEKIELTCEEISEFLLEQWDHKADLEKLWVPGVDTPLQEERDAQILKSIVHIKEEEIRTLLAFLETPTHTRMVVTDE